MIDKDGNIKFDELDHRMFRIAHATFADWIQKKKAHQSNGNVGMKNPFAAAAAAAAARNRNRNGDAL